MPVRAAAVASAAVTVVLPTPPLPATITTREVEQKRSRSMAIDATGVPIAHRMRRAHRARSSLVVALRVVARARRASARRRRRSRSASAASTSSRSRATSTRPTSSLVLDAITQRERQSAPRCSILQLDSSGAIDIDIEARRPRDPAARGCRSSVWVGPSGADAKGAATILLAGRARRLRLAGLGRRARPPGAPRRPGRRHAAPACADRAGRARRGATVAIPTAPRKLAARTGSARPRRSRVGADERRAPDHRRGDRAASTARRSPPRRAGEALDRQGDRHRHGPAAPAEPGRACSTGSASAARCCTRLISPSIAYFLIVVGLALIVFEFFTAAIGLAGLVGALCVVGAFVGFSHLPVALVGARPPLPRDVRVRDRRAGRRPRRRGRSSATASLVAGSFSSTAASSQLRPAWWVVLVVIVGTLFFMLGGMTAMIRARFSTPTVGREGMIGEDGDGRGRRRSRRRGADPGRPLAGPDQPGHPDPGRRPGQGGRGRGPGARGRAARGRGARTTASGPGTGRPSPAT